MHKKISVTDLRTLCTLTLEYNPALKVTAFKLTGHGAPTIGARFDLQALELALEHGGTAIYKRPDAWRPVSKIDVVFEDHGQIRIFVRVTETRDNTWLYNYELVLSARDRKALLWWFTQDFIYAR